MNGPTRSIPASLPTAPATLSVLPANGFRLGGCAGAGIPGFYGGKREIGSLTLDSTEVYLFFVQQLWEYGQKNGPGSPPPHCKRPRGVAIARFSNEQTAELNTAIKPRLAAVYEASASLFSKRGQQIVDRAMKNGAVGGDVGMQLLFEPAMLLSLVAPADASYELGAVAKDIPFIGNYNQWLPASAAIAAAYRTLADTDDPRTPDIETWLALPGHGGSGDAMANRLQGRLAEQIRSDAYAPPLKLPQLSYVIGKLRELSVMWAFGGSESWSRERIDKEIFTVRSQVADF